VAGSFRIAEGYVEVTADESGYDRAIDRLKSKKTTVKIGLDVDDREAVAKIERLARDRLLNVKLRVDDTALARLKLNDITVTVAPKISDAAYNRVKAQLDRLTKERVVNIRATVDTRVAADEIRNLTQRRQVRIGIDVDTRVAADSLANLTRRRNMTVGVNLNSTDARARLDALTRNRNVRVDADVSSLSRLGSSGGGLGSLISSLSSLTAAAIGALPTLASLGQSIIQMGPAAAIAAPAILSVGAAFAAIKLGTSGIGDAFKAAFAPAAKAAGAAATATHQVESAQRSLAKATQAVKDAEVNAAAARVKAARDIRDAQQSLKNTISDVADSNRRAAESVAGAERDLADAQRAAKQAQQDLTQARKDAAQELEDLNARLVDAQLDQRQKVLDLSDAEKQLATDKAAGSKVSADQLAKDQLAYDKAVQALSEQQTETKRLQEQADAANKAGVEGSATVTKAKKGVADATQTVTDKTQALKDAEIEASRTQVDGAQKVAKAQRDVADAQAAAAKAATDGARQIADAQLNAKEAAEALAAAQTKGATAVNATATALSKLSPQARAFVDAVLAQREAWRSLKLDVQDRLFAGLGQKFTALSTAVLPSLHTGLTGTAGVLNTMAKNAADAVINLAKTGTLKKMFAGLNAGLKPLAKVPGQFIKGLVQISVAASPAFKRVTTAAGGFFTQISEKINTAVKNGHMETAINQALDIAKQFGKLIGDVFGTLGNVMKAASAGGGDALGAIGEAFKELRRITALPEVQKALTSIFTAVNAIAKLFAGTLGAVIEAVLPLLAALAPVVTELAEKFGPVLAELAMTLGKALAPIIDALLPIVSDVGTIIIGLVQAVMPLLGPLGTLIGAIVAAIGPIIGAIGSALVPVIAALTQGLAPVVTALVPVVQQFGMFLGQLAPLFPVLFQALLPLLPPIAQLTVSLLTLAMQVITPLMPLIVGLATIITNVLAGAITTLVPGITMVIDWLTKFAGAVTNVVKWIFDKFTWLYDVLVGHSIIPDLVNAIVKWFTSLWTSTKQIFTTLKNGVVQIWKDLWSAVSGAWSTFYNGLKNSLNGAWTWVKNSFSGLKTSITGTWSTMWTSAKNAVTSVFSTINTKISGFGTGMRNAFTNLKNALGTIWDGVKSKIASPIKFVVGTVYNNGIRKMWNSIAGKVSSKITLPAISLGFNRGGVVPGTGNSDTVPAMLTPGERILSKQQVTKLGGHRGIDAILGQDRPTKTGGNPSRQEERQRYQGGTQHFGNGGIVGTVTNAIGGAISGATSWAKDIVIGGLKSAAQKALSSLVRPLINRIPGGNNIGGLMKDTSNKAVDSMLNWFTNEDKKAVGGPAVQKALSWVKTQNGLPYQWAGNGNPSWDCSGLMSAIESVIRGEKPHRRWATGSFVGNNGPAGWVRNLNSPFMIGITNAGVGHTAGTLAGMNVESSGGAGVHMGKSARGYNNSLFTSHWGFAPAAKYDQGGLLADGATMVVKNTRKPERVLDPQQTALFEQLVNGGARGASSITIENITVSGTFDFSDAASRKTAATALADDIKEALRKLDNSRRR
jgi:phage-related protein